MGSTIWAGQSVDPKVESCWVALGNIVNLAVDMHIEATPRRAEALLSTSLNPSGPFSTVRHHHWPNNRAVSLPPLVDVLPISD